jgi:hypothetical protein
MQRKVTSLAMAGVFGVAGLTAGAVLAPAVASAASGDTTAAAAVRDRVSEIKEALAGLVKDGTLTQAQANKVATTLDQKLPRGGHGGHGGHGFGRPHLDAAASALGMTEDQLVQQLQSGKSLADVAKAKNVSVDTLVSKLVTAAQTDLAAAVKAGRLTQAQADSLKTDLKARVTDMVNRQGFGRGGHRGHDDDDAPNPGSSSTPSTSSSASVSST